MGGFLQTQAVVISGHHVTAVMSRPGTSCGNCATTRHGTIESYLMSCNSTLVSVAI